MGEYGDKKGGASGASVKTGLSKQEKISAEKAKGTKNTMPKKPKGSETKAGKTFPYA